MNINPLDVPGTLFEVELLNPNPSSSRKGYRISFQVSEEVHSAFMAAKESNLRLIGRLAVAHDNDDQPAADAVNGKPKKPKEPKGPYSYFWEYLNPNSGKGGSGFATLPGVREVVEAQRITETEPVWELLHRVFGVGGGTLAFTSDLDVLAKFPDNEQVALFVRRAQNFQVEREAKQ
jgi:hypothetical protein